MSETLQELSVPLGREERRELYRRPRWRASAQTLCIVAGYALCAFVVVSPELGPLRFAAIPLMGLALAGCIAAAHDCFHVSLYANKRRNRIAGALWCAVVLNNFSSLKYAHLVHHRFTRVEGDSEGRFGLPRAWSHARLFLSAPFLLRRGVLRALRISTRRLIMPHVVTERMQAESRHDAMLTLAWLLTAAVLTLWQPMAMLLAYWLPLALFPPFAMSITMPEHHGCDEGPNILAATRSTRSNALVRFLIWNSNYHVEHHLLPGVPSCNLPTLHRRVVSELKHLAPGYIAFHWGVFCQLWRQGRADVECEAP